MNVAHVVLGIRHRKTVRSGDVRAKQLKTRTAELEFSVNTANNTINQLELPALFHATCLSLYVAESMSYPSVSLAWLLVLPSYARFWFQLTKNRIKFRSRALILRWLMLGLLWIWFMLQLCKLDLNRALKSAKLGA